MNEAQEFMDVAADAVRRGDDREAAECYQEAAITYCKAGLRASALLPILCAISVFLRNGLPQRAKSALADADKIVEDLNGVGVEEHILESIRTRRHQVNYELSQVVPAKPVEPPAEGDEKKTGGDETKANGDASSTQATTP
jgi:HEPN domain-containing protein